MLSALEGGCELRISQNFIPQIITPHDMMGVKNEMRLKVGMMIRYRYMILMKGISIAELYCTQGVGRQRHAGD